MIICFIENNLTIKVFFLISFFNKLDKDFSVVFLLFLRE